MSFNLKLQQSSSPLPQIAEFSSRGFKQVNSSPLSPRRHPTGSQNSRDSSKALLHHKMSHRSLASNMVAMQKNMTTNNKRHLKADKNDMHGKSIILSRLGYTKAQHFSSIGSQRSSSSERQLIDPYKSIDNSKKNSKSKNHSKDK